VPRKKQINHEKESPNDCEDDRSTTVLEMATQPSKQKVGYSYIALYDRYPLSIATSSDNRKMQYDRKKIENTFS